MTVQTSTANPQADTAFDEPDEDVRGAIVGWGDYARALLRDRVALFSLTVLMLMLLAALGAQWLVPYDPTVPNLRATLLPPMALGTDGFPHFLGTDELGRDMFSRLLHGAQVSISVGVIGALCSGIVGITLGLLAGFYRGWLEDVVMRAVDGMLALPSLLLALFILFVIGPGYFNLILIFTLLHWMVFARMARGLALNNREAAYIVAAKAVGCKNSRIITRHLLPNMYSPLLVLFNLEVAILILSEASLSFLGFGVQPPQASWGLMIARGREYIVEAWWYVTFPGLAIFLTALCLNLLAGWVRTITDPVQRWRWLVPQQSPQPAAPAQAA